MNIEAVDIVVLIMVSALALTLLAASYNVSIRGSEVSPTREKILTALIASLMAAVSLFIGARLEQDPCCKLLETKGAVKLQAAEGLPEELAVLPEQVREALNRQRGLLDAMEEIGKASKKELMKEEKEEEESLNPASPGRPNTP